MAIELKPKTTQSVHVKTIDELVDFSGCEITEEQRQQLRSLLAEFEDRVSKTPYDLGDCNTFPVDIDVGDVRFPDYKPRLNKIPMKYQKVLEEHFKNLVEAKRIVPCSTPFLHSVVLVPKKVDGRPVEATTAPTTDTLRLAVDFRPLNKLTRLPDRYPVGDISNLIHRLRGKTYFSTIDLTQSFLQLRLTKRSQRLCGVMGPDQGKYKGTWAYRFMPYGLTGAASAFSRVLSQILAPVDNTLAYIDDVIVFTETWEEHLSTLRKVLTLFRKHDLKISGKKARLARRGLTFLAHEISPDGYRPGIKNVEAIERFPTPKNVRETRRFIGMSGFFRKFIQNYSTVVRPLHDLVKEEKRKKFSWGEAEEKAFQKIKNCLTSAPVLAYPRDAPFELHTDGSNVAVGAVLLQASEEEPSRLAAIGYFSKSLTEAQRRWSPTQIELFAILSALRFFKPIIYGCHTTIKSDHKPLTFLLNTKKDMPDSLARWIIEIGSYPVTIAYQKGAINHTADALSRIERKLTKKEEEDEEEPELPICMAMNVTTDQEIRIPRRIRPYDVLVEQLEDSTCQQVFAIINNERYEGEIDKKTIELADNCSIHKNGCLYFRKVDGSKKAKDLLLIPEKLRQLIFTALHENCITGGHFNWKKTTAKIERAYYWSGLAKDIYQLCRACELCQRKLARTSNKEELRIVNTRYINARVHIDLAGPYHMSEAGNKYIVCLIDHFSKFAVTAAVPDCKATTVAHKVLTEYILRYGAMRELVSDNATTFTAEVATEIGKLLAIDKYFTTPYHHEGNGECERMFATLQPMLRTYIQDNIQQWDVWLPSITFAYNTSVHSSTAETPFFIMHGREPVLSLELLLRTHEEQHIPRDTEAGYYKAVLLHTLHNTWKQVIEHNAKASSQFKANAEKRTRKKPLEIEVGDRVFLKDEIPKIGISKKLCLPFQGQFRVIEKTPPHLVIISITAPNAGPKRVHANQVKKAWTISGPVFTKPWLPKEEEDGLQRHQATNHDVPGYPPPSKAKEETNKPEDTEHISHSYNLRPKKGTYFASDVARRKKVNFAE